MTLDKDPFPIENINLFIGDFTVDQQRHLQLNQGLKHRLEPIQAGHSQIRVR